MLTLCVCVPGLRMKGENWNSQPVHVIAPFCRNKSSLVHHGAWINCQSMAVMQLDALIRVPLFQPTAITTPPTHTHLTHTIARSHLTHTHTSHTQSHGHTHTPHTHSTLTQLRARPIRKRLEHWISAVALSPRPVQTWPRKDNKDLCAETQLFFRQR